MKSGLGGLWQHSDFLKLWAAQTISQFGSQFTMLALPLIAAVMLKATAVQMGVLGATAFAPFLLLGLFAGAWVDRLRRRLILITMDLARAGLLLAIPAAAWMGMLRIEVLYLVAAFAGVCTV